MTRNNQPSSAPATASVPAAATSATTRQQAFALLRAGLWNSSADATLFGGDTDWDTILTFAARQTVAALVAEAIGTLPHACQPPAPVMHRQRSIVTTTMRSHALLNRALVETVTMFRAAGIEPILLKGQGVARNYAVYTLRQCGDIDLYIGSHQYPRARALARAWEPDDQSATESTKHYHFHHGRVTVELHRIAETLPLPWHNRRFQRWTQHYLTVPTAAEQAASPVLRSVLIGGAEITLPPVQFDVLYIFNHLWHHFAEGGGIGLRQLCDWVRYLHTFASQIDRAQLRTDLHSLGLWRPWCLCGTIAVDELGLPEAEFPFYTRRYALQAQQIVAMIEDAGNFGFYDLAAQGRPDGYVAGKVHSLRRMHRRYGQLLRICPRETLAAWARYIYTGIRQVIVVEGMRKKKTISPQSVS